VNLIAVVLVKLDYSPRLILCATHINFTQVRFRPRPDNEVYPGGRLRNTTLDIDIMFQKLNDISDKPISIDQLCAIFKLPESSEIDSTPEEAYTVAIYVFKIKVAIGIKIKKLFSQIFRDYLLIWDSSLY
jgi:hypothetical protein